MNHTRKWQSLLLATALLAPMILAACSSGNEEPSPAGDTPAPAASEAAEAASETAEDPQTAGDVTTMTCFINHTWYWTDKFEGIIPEAITERTGVALDVTRAVDDKQLGLMIASGDLPELVYTSTELDRLSDPNLVYPYNELIAQHCPDWQPDNLRITNAKAFSGDDNYYFLLQNFNPASEWEQYPGTSMVPTLAYRADLLEELGNPPMENLDDFVAVLGMVKEKYPDKIPLATSADRGWRMMVFRVWMGVGNADFIEMDDGSVVHFTSHPQYKEYCRFINSLYRQGYIDADNFSISESDTKTLVQNAQCFAFTGYSQGEMYRFGEMAKKVEPNAKIMESKPLDTKGKYYINSIGWSGLAITKNCSDPEKAIKMMEYLFTDEGQKLGEWGREGIEWTMGDDGYPVFTEDWLSASTDESTFYKKYNPAFFFGTSAAVEATGRIAVLPEDYRAVYQDFRPLMDYCPWMRYAEPKGDIEEKTILTKLTDLRDSNEVKVFLSASDEEFEKNYEEYIANARQIGVEQLEAFMTEGVADAKTLYQ